MLFVVKTIIEQGLVHTSPCKEQMLIGNYLLTAGAAATSTSGCRIITLAVRDILNACFLKAITHK